MRQGFGLFLRGVIPCPDQALTPEAYYVWLHNDEALKGLLLETISPVDRSLVRDLKTSFEIFTKLRARHENLGPFAQILLVKKMLDVKFIEGTPLSQTITEIRDIHRRVVTMGTIDDDHLLTVALLNALGEPFSHLQSAIQTLSSAPNFSSTSVIRRIEEEENLMKCRTDGGHLPTPQHTALAATASRPPKVPCSNCRRLNHSSDFCISPGGKLAGKTIDEARAAQAAHRAASQNRPPRTQPATALVASPTPPPPTPQTLFTFDGTHFVPVTSTPSPPSDKALPEPVSAYTSFVDPSLPDNSYRTYLALAPFPTSASIVELNDSSDTLPDFPHTTSVNWSNDQPSAYTTTSYTASSHIDKPFIFDSGATCHISPNRDDFYSFRTINPRPVTGLGGSSVDAVGCGSIELILAAGHKLLLHDVLYIPSSDVRLVSVLALNESGDYTCHFDRRTCWITDTSDTIIARGRVLPSRRLYSFDSPYPNVSRSFSHSSPSAHLARPVPDVETWHRRLGHLNHDTIVAMARSKAVQGMPIDISFTPPKCDSCILGKQTRSSVPKVREGVRASRPLERVFLDLCGPMSVASRSGRLYSMNVIDDYTSYVWSLPLRNKSDAIVVLQGWHAAVQNQSGHRLTYLITDNGELSSHSMTVFCSRNGITHLFTAPYTSAHNGRAERLHRTLHEKARTMRLACNAPQSMWDEFCATAAFLTNLSASSSLHGRTPYERWFNRLPSLSHLREIGCRAYALVQSHNPKLNPRSIPCIMIGYGRDTKAYRLWDPSTNKIFNSFHVTFVERLDSLPSPLSPNTTLGTDSADAPGSWDAPTIPSRSDPPPSHAPPSHAPPSHAPPTPPSPLIAPQSTPVHYPAPLSIDNTPPNNSNRNTNSVTTSNNNNVSTSINNTVSTTNNNTVTTNNCSTNTVSHSNNNPVTQTTYHKTPYDTNASPNNTNNNNINTTNNQSETAPYDTTSSSLNNNTIPYDTANNESVSNNPPTNTITNSTNPIPTDSTTQTTHAPPAPSLRRSSRIAARGAATEPSPPEAHITQAFLSEYSIFRESHDLFPLSLPPDLPLSTSINTALVSLSDGSLIPEPDSDDDPLWAKALASPEREFWIAGAKDEIQSLKDLKVFVLVPRSDVPRGQRPLKGKLVCKCKRDDSGNVVRYKVRYVAKGYTQRYGVDYEKTTAPTARLESFRSLLHLGACLDWEIEQYDIKTAFLHGVLPESETMFMEQPPGFEAPGKEDWVMRLMKSIYGMKQASRVWNQTFDKAVQSWGFTRVPCEWCVYHRRSTEGTIIFAVHVDDIISIASSVAENDRFKAELNSKWKISDLGPVKFALGIAVARDRANHTISLSQTALIDRIVSEFGQRDAHPVDTPMVTGHHLLRPDKDAPVPESTSAWIERTPYRSLIGCLNYLAVATRPDIAYAVGRLAGFLDCYRPEHWEAATRVVRYLKGSRDLSLQLGGTNPPTLLGYSDSDYANCPSSSKSIGGYCFTLGSGVISWASRKQKTVADSSCYAEYIALHEASHEIVFLRELLSHLLHPISSPTTLYCDNDAASQLAEDHVWHARVKHIRVKYHYIRELVTNNELSVARVRSSENTADILTKALNRTDFTRLRHYLGLKITPGAPGAC